MCFVRCPATTATPQQTAEQRAGQFMREVVLSVKVSSAKLFLLIKKWQRGGGGHWEYWKKRLDGSETALTSRTDRETLWRSIRVCLFQLSSQDCRSLGSVLRLPRMPGSSVLSTKASTCYVPTVRLKTQLSGQLHTRPYTHMHRQQSHTTEWILSRRQEWENRTPGIRGLPAEGRWKKWGAVTPPSGSHVA